MTKTTISASPAKLRDGSWGVRFTTSLNYSIIGGKVSSPFPLRVKITTRNGKTWEAVVEEILGCWKSRKRGQYDYLARTK